MTTHPEPAPEPYHETDPLDPIPGGDPDEPGPTSTPGAGEPLPG
jgi:hypothetical protein